MDIPNGSFDVSQDCNRNVRPTNNSGFSLSWKLNFKEQGVAQSKPFTRTKAKLPKTKVDVSTGSKNKFDT